MKRKRFEIDTTPGFFGIGIITNPIYRGYEDVKYIGIILGFLVLRWNINTPKSTT